MTNDLVLRDEAPANIFGAVEPEAVIERASSIATALKDVLKRQGLVSNISGKQFVNVEGWTLLGSMLGVFPVVDWTHPILDAEGHPLGWEARVTAQTRHGEVIGAAEAMCLRTERFGRGKDDYAIRAMAQTRATSRAMRGPLGFVVVLAGYEATAPEEMPREVSEDEQARTGRLVTTADETGEGSDADDSLAEGGGEVAPAASPPSDPTSKERLVAEIERLRTKLGLTTGAIILRARKPVEAGGWGIDGTIASPNFLLLPDDVLVRIGTELTLMAGE